MIIKFEICQPGFYSPAFWSKILRRERHLAHSQPTALTAWMLDQYKCKMLTDNFGGFIGVDIEDDGLTMLLLKYPTYDVQV